MNIEDIDGIGELGLSRRTLEELNIDKTQAIVNDEFNSHDVGDYLNRAINRLIKLGIPFDSESNIVFNMAERFIKIICPYCHRNMKFQGGSGNGMDHSAHYICYHCDAEGFIHIPKNGISFVKDNTE